MTQTNEQNILVTNNIETCLPLGIYATHQVQLVMLAHAHINRRVAENGVDYELPSYSCLLKGSFGRKHESYLRGLTARKGI